MFLTPRRMVALLLTTAMIGGAGFAPLTSSAAPSADTTIDSELTSSVTNNWADVGGNLTNDRYSSLNQIATWNVANLKPVAETSLLGSGPAATKYWTKYNDEATPLVQDGVMYISTGNDDVYALNAVTGAKIWTYHSKIAENDSTICCEWDNRGVAIGQGLVFDSQIDGGIVAISQSTGKQVWKDQLVKWQLGGGVTAAPLYFNGVVYIGTVGGEFGQRGTLYALDAATGKQLWHFYTIPGPKDVGGNTWPNNGSYLKGGGTIWNTPAVDPSLGLLYFSTGNASPDLYGGNRKGEDLFTSSIVALHIQTGKLALVLQEVHHDLWDFDLPSPVLLFDTVIDGKLRHGISQTGKPGFTFLLDRATGKPLLGVTEKPVPQYAPQATYPTQPYPVGDPVIPQCAQPVKGFTSVCVYSPVTNKDQVFQPLYNGGVDESPVSFSPQTGYDYIGADNQPFDATYSVQPFKVGQFWLDGGATNTLGGAVNSGTFTAIDTRTNKIVWQKQLTDEDGSGAGAMSTAGGLVFSGQIDGWLKAYDAKTGKVLWQFQTGLPDNAPPMTYDVNGVQYLAVDVGGHGYLSGAQAAHDTLWIFAVKPSTQTFLQPASPAPIDNKDTVSAGAPVHTGKVAIIDYGYKPFGAAAGFGSLVISVNVGSTITWVNTGSQPHTSTSQDGGWNTGIIVPGGSATTTMNKVGTFHFYCIPHPWMTGEVIVTPV